MDIKEMKLAVEGWLKEYFENKGSYNQKLYESMSYSIEVGGKRIRPILMMLTYDLYKEDYREILPMASAVEMIHTYSLIHDDLPCMDDDDLRRGKPTNHIKFGEAVAVLAGDALLNEAMNIMLKSSISNGMPWLKASYVIAKSSGAEGMVGGQIVDILSEGKNISAEELNYMHEKKTGELIICSILAGAILGNAPEEEINILRSYGEKLGLAFQIEDDILDVIGDEKLLGKSIHKDSKSHKNTFVSLYGLDTCKKMCKDITDNCIKDLNRIPRNTQYLKEITLELLNRDF